MKPETLGEVNIMFQNLLGEVEKLTHAVSENTKLTEQVLIQATKTNGRVNLIEPLALDYQETRAQARGAVRIIALIGVAVLGVGGFALNSYIDYKTKEITETIVKIIENKQKNHAENI